MTTVDSVCVHHWVIDEPNGPESTGACQKCGMVAKFANTIPGSGDWRDENRVHYNLLRDKSALKAVSDADYEVAAAERQALRDGWASIS